MQQHMMDTLHSITLYVATMTLLSGWLVQTQLYSSCWLRVGSQVMFVVVEYFSRPENRTMLMTVMLERVSVDENGLTADTYMMPTLNMSTR